MGFSKDSQERSLLADYYKLAEEFWHMPNTSAAWSAFNDAGHTFCEKYPGEYSRDLFKALVWQVMKNVVEVDE